MSQRELHGKKAIVTDAARTFGFTKVLGQEFAGSGVIANCITPAMTGTELFAEMREDYIADPRERIPTGRSCTVREIIDMTAFATSPECSSTTGFAFDITGGRTTYCVQLL